MRLSIQKNQRIICSRLKYRNLSFLLILLVILAGVMVAPPTLASFKNSREPKDAPRMNTITFPQPAERITIYERSTFPLDGPFPLNVPFAERSLVTEEFSLPANVAEPYEIAINSFGFGFRFSPLIIDLNDEIIEPVIQTVIDPNPEQPPFGRRR